MEHLLTVLDPHCPVKIDAVRKNRRRVEHGLTTVGLKIHCLGDNRELLNLIEALGGRSEVIGSRVYACTEAQPVSKMHSAANAVAVSKNNRTTASPRMLAAPNVYDSTGRVCSPWASLGRKFTGRTRGAAGDQSVELTP
jgi:hypothetical protein